ncbi:MAG: DUF4890 domain-containing protein [Sphingobacteriales bacterium]|nr:DUF4890 domain-containing protein [Sphingobacteriales bacterium]
MKKYILSITLFIAVAATAFGQQKSPEERATKSTEMMAKNLSLTPNQKTKIHDATLERMKAMEALRAAAGKGNKPDPAQMKAINKKFNDVLQTTLTDEQKAKWKELRAQRGNGRQKP